MKDLSAATAPFLLLFTLAVGVGILSGWREGDLDREGVELLIFGRPCDACVEVEVPVTRIEAGQVVQPSDLMTVSLPAAYLPATAVVLHPAGATTRSVLYAGHLVRQERLK